MIFHITIFACGAQATRPVRPATGLIQVEGKAEAATLSQIMNTANVAEWSAKMNNTFRSQSPNKSLEQVLAPFKSEQGYTFEALKKATETRDVWGALIGVPDLVELQSLDQDGDKLVSKGELMKFQGLQHRFCRNLGEVKYECKKRCTKGHDKFDGDYAYFAGTTTKTYLFKKDSYEFLNKIDRTGAGAISTAQRRAIGMGLYEVIKAGNVDGAVCELGVFHGQTSTFLWSLLTELDATDKHPLHLFDSFEGLPDCDKKMDGGMCGPGQMSVPEDKVKQSFLNRNFPVPPMHKGFFSDISDSEFPEKIAFAFIDADLYPSMLSGLQKVWPRLSKGAVVFLHDYAWEGYPGTELAAHNFLADKVERVQLPGGHDGVACNLGYLRKQ